MNLHDLVVVLRRRWISVAVVAAAVLGLTAVGTFLMTPQYTASARLFFGVQGGESVADLAQGSTFTAKQMSSYAEVATSPLVLDRVISDLGLPTSAAELASRISATAAPDTVILEISASDPVPARAAAISNAVADQLTAVTGDLSPAQPDGSESVRATVLAPAVVPIDPSSPVVLRNLALGLVGGLILGVGGALLRQILDTKIRDERDVQSLTSTAVLGVVPFDGGASAHPVVMVDEPLGARSEAIRRLRTNLQFVDVADGLRSLVITSSLPSEGKSTTAINLAVSIAETGAHVILIDGDLRRPSLARYLELEGAVGLTTVLIGRAEIEDVVQPWQGTTLDILPAGQIPPNPSELLGSKAMAQLLRDLGDVYDMVIIDSAPLLPVIDAAILSKVVDGTLVVVGADRTHRSQLAQALESLSTVGASVVGTVVNKVSRRGNSAYVYYSGYSSDAQPDVGAAPVRENDGARALVPSRDAR